LNLSVIIKSWFGQDATAEKLLSSYVKDGESQYIEALIAKFNQSLFHYLLSLSEPHIAEDVLQATWTKVIALKHNNSAMAHTNVKSWLFTIARNLLIDELRRLQRWQFQDYQDSESTSLSLEQELSNTYTLEAFNRALEALPFAQKEAFIFQQEGFSVKQIAELTNSSFEAVKSRLRYARQQLKQQLESENGK